MKVVGLVILAVIAFAVLTGSCSGGEFFTYTGDPPTLADLGSTSTSALTSNQLPPPPPPSAAIHRAARPAVWAAGVCGAVEAWATNWESRTREVNQHLVSADGIPAEVARDLYVDFWGETTTKTDLASPNGCGGPSGRPRRRRGRPRLQVGVREGAAADADGARSGGCATRRPGTGFRRDCRDQVEHGSGV